MLQVNLALTTSDQTALIEFICLIMSPTSSGLGQRKTELKKLSASGIEACWLVSIGGTASAIFCTISLLNLSAIEIVVKPTGYILQL